MSRGYWFTISFVAASTLFVSLININLLRVNERQSSDRLHENSLIPEAIERCKEDTIKATSNDNVTLPSPSVFLHVGPGKMATTTIQESIDNDTCELSQDNFCIYNPQKFQAQGGAIRLGLYNDLKHPRAQKMLHFFEYCHDIQQSMLLSSEDLGLLDKENWERVLKPSFQMWGKTTIVVGYRRFYFWAHSVWFQIFRNYIERGWPKNIDDMSSQIPSFHEFYHTTDILKLLYTDNYIDHWRELGIEDFLVYNVHESPNVVKNFYCSTLGLTHTCEKYLDMPTVKTVNKGFGIQHDRLACALYFKNFIDPKKIDRVEAGKKILNFFKERNIVFEEISQSCFTEAEMDAVLERSKKLEEKLLPDFYASERGMLTMADELQEARDKLFCEVNITDVINKYGEDLRSIFS